MIAVLKKELSSYFKTMTGYALIAFLIVFTGIYFMVYNMYQGYPHFSYTLSGVINIMFIWIPVLTMRSFAEERKAKTDQLLFTAPVKISSVVIGKYLAMTALLAVPTLIYCLFPLIIEVTGTASLLLDYIAILEFFLLGCAFIAMGMFFSSITDSPMIAAVATFAVIFITCIWETLVDYLPETAGGNIAIAVLFCFILAAWIFHLTKNKILTAIISIAGVISNIVAALIDSTLYENLAADILGKFNLMGAFENAAYYSVLDLQGTVLPLSVIAVFVFLTIQSIEKRRWS